MKVIGKDFDANINTVVNNLHREILNVYKTLNIILFPLKVVVLFYLKYNAELDSGHLFVAKAIFSKGSTLEVGRDPGYTSDGCYYIFRKHNRVKKSSKSRKIFFIYKDVF